MVSNNKIGVKEIAITGLLLAICIVSQFFKNLSIFITGPIINACIVLAVLAANLVCGIILSFITPVTAYFIAASPVMTAVPLIVPFIMLGNAVLAVAVHFLIMRIVKGCIHGTYHISLAVTHIYSGRKSPKTENARIPDNIFALSVPDRSYRICICIHHLGGAL